MSETPNEDPVEPEETQTGGHDDPEYGSLEGTDVEEGEDSATSE